jgi:hypothetical protein
MTAARGLSFEAIAAASPETLGMLMLKSDLHAARLGERAQHAAVIDALADGAATAEDLRKRFPGLSPRLIAGELHVTVETTDDDPMVSSIWRFAEYRPRPPHILLYTRGLAPLEQALVGAPAARLLGEATIEDVFVAHELYHHVETTRVETPIARRHQATLFQVGKWRWRTGIATLAEIAAGSFAQGLLGLPCHPKVLDFAAGEGILRRHSRQ